MVLIISSLGASHNYPDRPMMRRTLDRFLASLNGQTDMRFRLFLAGHDDPGDAYPWLDFSSIAVEGDETLDQALVPINYPSSAVTPVQFKVVESDGKNADMGRKTFHATVMAGQWALERGLREFWMLRMDSDDLLWNGAVDYLHALPPHVRAVFSRKAHLVDYRRGEIGEQVLSYSLTCNAMKFRLSESGVFDPDWYYHCRDHTTFAQSVHDDRIQYVERDHMICIATNSGNHISSRPGIAGELNAKVIPATEEVLSRYCIPRAEVEREAVGA